LVKLEFHGADTDTDTDILATILAMMSVSVLVPWNASFIKQCLRHYGQLLC